jgi:putative tryptophan/tyrosine transport system substrate-binding protein
VKRRTFIRLVGGAAAAWPLAARAQQAGKLPTIGFLGASPSIESQRVGAFVQRLRELGWVDGRNVAIEVRWAEGRSERYAENAAEFVRLKVDVIVTSATPPTVAAKQATAVIPIVFAAVTDPVGTGLVATLARPGGNVTGLANLISDTAGKKLEFLREVVPGLRRLAIMVNVGNPGSVMDMREAQAAARTLGLEVTSSEIRRAEDIAPAFETLKGRADAIYLCPDPLMNTNRTRINILAVGARLPTMHADRWAAVWSRVWRGPAAAPLGFCRPNLVLVGSGFRRQLLPDSPRAGLAALGHRRRRCHCRDARRASPGRSEGDTLASAENAGLTARGAGRQARRHQICGRVPYPSGPSRRITRQ